MQWKIEKCEIRNGRRKSCDGGRKVKSFKFCISEFLNFRIFEYLDLRISESLNFLISKCMEIQAATDD